MGGAREQGPLTRCRKAIALLAWFAAAACVPRGWRCEVTAAPNDFAIEMPRGVIVTSRATGVVRVAGASGSSIEWPRGDEPVVTVTREADGAPFRVPADRAGRFDVELTPGRYCFQITMPGFNRSVRRVEIRSGAPIRPIVFDLHPSA